MHNLRQIRLIQNYLKPISTGIGLGIAISLYLATLVLLTPVAAHYIANTAGHLATYAVMILPLCLALGFPLYLALQIHLMLDRRVSRLNRLNRR